MLPNLNLIHNFSYFQTFFVTKSFVIFPRGHIWQHFRSFDFNQWFFVNFKAISGVPFKFKSNLILGLAKIITFFNQYLDQSTDHNQSSRYYRYNNLRIITRTHSSDLLLLYLQRLSVEHMFMSISQFSWPLAYELYACLSQMLALVANLTVYQYFWRAALQLIGDLSASDSN